MEQRNRMLLIGSVLFGAVGMALVDGLLSPPYLLKSAIKLILFLLIPMLVCTNDRQKRERLRNIFLPGKKSVLLSLGLGVGVFAVILIAYALVKDHFDFSGITDALVSGEGVTADNFVFVSIYIALVNSLLEEFFFRGYAFLMLSSDTDQRFAYLFSAAMFTLYHAGMTDGWFHPMISVLVMVGLFVGGLIFDFLNDRFHSIYPSWFVHMCANLAINTIGMMLFGIL